MKKLLVSVVDDDRYFREFDARLIRSLGYTVEAFASAADFLVSPRLAETACVIADVNMPAMNGIELHRHLIDAGRAIPTILVTAYPNDVDRIRALNDGVVCYLRKPVDEQHLKRCLHAALTSSVIERLKKIHDLPCTVGQGELKYGAARFIRLCPQPAPMGLDDRPANRQPHPHAAGLRGVKCIEHALEMRRIDARPSRTATRTPVRSCSVLINRSRGFASTEPIASTAFRIRFRTTCCN